MQAKLINAAVLAVFACWIFVFGALIWSASKPLQADQNASRSGDTEHKASAPTPQHSATVQHEKTALENFFELKLTDVLLVIFTAVLAYKTSGLFTETAGLRDAAEKQRLDSLRSIEVAEGAARAAQKSADTGERALFVAYRPLITIAELELRSANSALGTPHIHFGIRNSGQGIAVVHWFNVTITLREQVGSKMVRTTSVTKTEWVSLIEPSETASGNTVTTPTIQERIADIWNGQLALYVSIEIKGQDFFSNRTDQRFPFMFDVGTNSFRRVNAGDDGAPLYGDEKQEIEQPPT